MSFGFTIRETLVGTCQVQGVSAGREIPLTLELEWGPRDIWKWLSPVSNVRGLSACSGRAVIEGVAGPVPVEGTLDLRYLKDRTIVYDMKMDVGGKNYKFMGKKSNIWPWNLPWSHTTCYVSMTDQVTEEPYATGTVRFRLQELPAFLRSVRLVHG